MLSNTLFNSLLTESGKLSTIFLISSKGDFNFLISSGHLRVANISLASSPLRSGFAKGPIPDPVSNPAENTGPSPPSILSFGTGRVSSLVVVVSGTGKAGVVFIKIPTRYLTNISADTLYGFTLLSPSLFCSSFSNSLHTSNSDIDLTALSKTSLSILKYLS